MTVVDTSRWQHEILPGVFTAWRQAGVTKVILKAGGGDSGRYEDSLYATNQGHADAAGMPTDVYWFNGTTDPVQDAIFLHSFIPARKRVWWDVENEGSMPHWGDSSLNAAARKGVSLGHPAGAYMSSSVTFGGWSQSSWMPLWVANYSASHVPAVGGGWKAVLWQYTSTGREPGYPGSLDISEIQQGWANLGNVTPIDPVPTISLEPEMKMVGVPGGTIALLTPTSGQKYSDPKAFEFVAALAAYGPAQTTYTDDKGSHPFTEDQVSNLVSVANARGAALAAAAAAKVPAPDLSPLLTAIGKISVSVSPVDPAALTAAVEAGVTAALKSARGTVAF